MTDSTDFVSPHAAPSLSLGRADGGCAAAKPRRFWSPETMRFGATFLGRLMRAMHRSRRRHAQRVIREHQHLIDAARERPLVSDVTESPPATAPHLSMRSEASGLLAAVSEWRGAVAPPRTSEQTRS